MPMNQVIEKYAFKQAPHLACNGYDYLFWLNDTSEKHDDAKAHQIIHEYIRHIAENLNESKMIYRAQTAIYAMAKLSHMIECDEIRLKLENISSFDDIDGDLHHLLTKLVVAVNKTITQSLPNGLMISEWLKSESCWESIKEMDVS